MLIAAPRRVTDLIEGELLSQSGHEAGAPAQRAARHLRGVRSRQRQEVRSCEVVWVLQRRKRPYGGNGKGGGGGAATLRSLRNQSEWNGPDVLLH